MSFVQFRPRVPTHLVTCKPALLIKDSVVVIGIKKVIYLNFNRYNISLYKA